MIGDIKINSTNIVTSFLSRFGYDLILLFCSGFFFCLFLLGTLQIDKMSGIGNQVGTITAGTAERKLSGEKAFATIHPQSVLHNMDTLWVGRKSYATIEMESGQTLNLSELTLIILKQHFKPVVQNGKKLGIDFEIVKGRVVLDNQTSLTGDADANLAFNLSGQSEETSSDASSSKDTVGIYPLENSIIYTRSPSEVELTFTWPKALTGTLVVRSRTDGQMYYTAIANQRSAPVKIPQSSEFFWQIMNANDIVELGPFQFELRRVVNETEVKEIFKNQTTEKPIQVYW